MSMEDILLCIENEVDCNKCKMFLKCYDDVKIGKGKQDFTKWTKKREFIPQLNSDMFKNK